MKKQSPISFEFVYQVFSLILIMIVVHAFYTALIRPRAEAFLKKQAAAIEAGEQASEARSTYVLIKDYEQETCFILLFWAIAIIGLKSVKTLKERSLLNQDLTGIEEGMRILPEDTRDLSRQLQELPAAKRNALIPRALLTALHRFSSSRNVQDVSTAAHTLCSTEADRLESELSMIRYIAWAIPSIGFIGTVRGIGEALGRAHEAIEGDISGVTSSLGVAFNSTLIALFISIILMFIVHQLQLMQERYVLDAENYCDERLIRHMHTR
jgi:biopolymer transport protein ExbB/TolQ